MEGAIMEDRDVAVEALECFIKARTPLDDYIQRRYGTHDKKFQDSKRESVARRVYVADELVRLLPRGRIELNIYPAVYPAEKYHVLRDALLEFANSGETNEAKKHASEIVFR